MTNLPFSPSQASVLFLRRWRWICTMLLMLCGIAHAELAEKVAGRMKKSTVRLVILEDGKVKGHGSGFIISSQGHVATNRHVIAKADKTVVVYSMGDRVFMKGAALVGVSSTADLAILKIDPIPATDVVQIATAELAAGQAVMSVGFPGAIDSGAWATLKGVTFDSKSGEGRITSPEARSDFEPAVFPGAVAKTLTDSGTRLVLHSAKISGGNSGGPLVDADGRVCGINTAVIPASLAGADYPISIHASELVTLARKHGIPIDVVSSGIASGKEALPEVKSSDPAEVVKLPDPVAVVKPPPSMDPSLPKVRNENDGNSLQMLLLLVLAAFAVVMFLLVLRKPRMVMVDALSRVARSNRHAAGQPAHRAATPAQASPRSSSNGRGMRLRGRDFHGISYDIAFNDADFQRSGGRLVIGRNHDLSQLHLSHDSVSRQHATLSWQGGTVHVEDRNSGNGTKVNGRELTVGSPPCPLQPGDRLTLGEVDLMFEIFN